MSVLAEVVGSTLGPGGRNVLIARGNETHVTKDGATVAQYVTSGDKDVDKIINLAREASQKTAFEAGDGTTTSTILTYAFYSAGVDLLAEGYDIQQVRKIWDKALEGVLEEVSKNAILVDPQDIEVLKKIAKISSNGDVELSNLIAPTVSEVGVTGKITVKPSVTGKAYVEKQKGFILDKGWGNTEIPSVASTEISAKEPVVIVTDYAFKTLDSIAPFLEAFANNGTQFVLFGERLTEEAAVAFYGNVSRGIIKGTFVPGPNFGHQQQEVLKDLAGYCGATFMSQTVGIEPTDFDVTYLGEADSLAVFKDKTVVFRESPGDKFKERQETLKALMDADPKTEEHYTKQLKEREQYMNGSLAQLFLHARTEAEMKEKVDRADDVIRACQSTLEEGRVPGAGKMFQGLCSSDTQSDFGKILDSFYYALKEPTRKLASNLGTTPEDLRISEDVIDPAKVVRCAIINSYSIAMTLLSTNSLVMV